MLKEKNIKEYSFITLGEKISDKNQNLYHI